MSTGCELDANQSSTQSDARLSGEILLVSNGPGELYTWVYPLLRVLRRDYPAWTPRICLIPCQFASGSESTVAQHMLAELAPELLQPSQASVHSPAQVLRFLTTGYGLAGVRPARGPRRGAVLSLGGGVSFALQLAARLGYPCYRYSFQAMQHRKLRKLYVPHRSVWRRARLLGMPAARLEQVGNLVADALHLPQDSVATGKPHVLLMFGSRKQFARPIIPLMIALADGIGQAFPEARFVAPLSRLLDAQTLAAGFSGEERAVLGGMAASHHHSAAGDYLQTPAGVRIDLVPETARYAHMRQADMALTIPGTNTLELGIAAVPSVVLLPLNQPELIPLDGPGHWLSLLPGIGTMLKRYAVRLAAPHLPVSLPNHFSKRDLMVELKGELQLEHILARTLQLLRDPAELQQRRQGLLETMPQPGAAARLLASLMADLEQL